MMSRSIDVLERIMDRYTTANLEGISPENFKGNIDTFMEIDDGEMEGYKDESRQRDLSVRFMWGHDHDFGSFKVKGLMGNRHVEILAALIDAGHLQADLIGKKVLDVGCWTGGMSLLLVGMGAEVVAIEEVRKYARAVRFLASSFGIADQLTVRSTSLYECNDLEFLDTFDYVIMAGVLYHVTDPVLALRMMFNCLSDVGTILIETQFHDADDRLLRYAGPRQAFGKKGKRIGWNWFTPTLQTLTRMLEDVGFVDVANRRLKDDRALVVAKRVGFVDMLRAGLSNRKIR